MPKKSPKCPQNAKLVDTLFRPAPVAPFIHKPALAAALVYKLEDTLFRSAPEAPLIYKLEDTLFRPTPAAPLINKLDLLCAVLVQYLPA